MTQATLYNPSQVRSRHHSSARNAAPICNTVLCLDVSPSMTWALTESISKLDAARQSLDIMIDGKARNHPGDRIAIVCFSNRASVLSPFRLAADPKLIAAISRARTYPSTNISAGLSLALDLHLQCRGPWHRNIILATDGMPMPPDSPDQVLATARRALAERVNIHTVGIGSTAHFDPELLKRVASTTHNGRYWHVFDLASFTNAIVTAGRM